MKSEGLQLLFLLKQTLIHSKMHRFLHNQHFFKTLNQNIRLWKTYSKQLIGGLPLIKQQIKNQVSKKNDYKTTVKS